MPSISELVSSAGLIFSGTVLERGASRVTTVPPDENLVVVRVDRGIRVDPALGDVRGRLITVASGNPAVLQPGQQAVFFTRSWIHAKEIAVHEIAHTDVQTQDEIAAVVRSLPDQHLKDRLEAAQIVVLAEVAQVRDVPDQIRDRRAPHWSLATLLVISALKGNADSLQLIFPTSRSHHWIQAPRFQEAQRGIFLLHRDEQRAQRWPVRAGALTALDPADFQPEARLAQIRDLLAGRQ